MSKDDSIIYKRGTFEKNGKLCGHNSDSSLRRIFPITERPLLQLVDVGGGNISPSTSSYKTRLYRLFMPWSSGSQLSILNNAERLSDM